MKRIKPAILLTCVLALLCTGWGYEGRRIVGEIAWHYLTPTAKAAVAKLLGADADNTLSEAATWADRIKSDRKWDWAKPLHYANVAPGAETFDLKRDCPKSGCVVSAIIKYRDVLRDKKATDAKKLEALKFIAHFVGDIHQPLHVSRAKDRGGNDIRVEFNYNATNLHRLWDSGLIRFNGEPWAAYAKSLRKSVKPDELKAWSSTDPVTWANESYTLALSNAYAVPEDGQLGPEYFQKNLPIVERRLKKAGARLAALLNEIYAAAAPVSPRERARISLERARVEAGTQARIKVIRTALELYQKHMGRFPTTPEGLVALVELPEDDEEAERWRGPYVKSVGALRDAWANDLIYRWPGEHNEESYDLSSAGPDGIAGNADDIVNGKR